MGDKTCLAMESKVLRFFLKINRGFYPSPPSLCHTFIPSVRATVVIAPNLAQAETSTDDIMTALYSLRRRVQELESEVAYLHSRINKLGY